MLRIEEEAGLPRIEPMLLRCVIDNHRYKILNTKRQSSLLVTAERHIPIINALDSGDADKAVQALSLHITTIVDFGPSILPPASNAGEVR